MVSLFLRLHVLFHLGREDLEKLIIFFCHLLSPVGSRGEHVHEEVGAVISGEHEPPEKEHRSGFDVISGA